MSMLAYVYLDSDQDPPAGDGWSSGRTGRQQLLRRRRHRQRGVQRPRDAKLRPRRERVWHHRRHKQRRCALSILTAS